MEKPCPQKAEIDGLKIKPENVFHRDMIKRMIGIIQVSLYTWQERYKRFAFKASGKK